MLYFRGQIHFSRFLAFLRKFMPLQISKQQNAKVLREILGNFENAKVFSQKKNCFSKQIYLSEICCFQKIITMDEYF